MTQTISRMYGAYDTAARAVEDLKKVGYRHIHVVSASGGPGLADTSHDGIVKAITDGYIWRPYAVEYAKRISQGGTLVSVHAPWATAKRAIKILDRHGPIESGVSEPTIPSVAWDDATPMSSALQMPVLMKQKTPISMILNVPAVLKNPIKMSACLGMPMLSKNIAPLSSRIGMSLLSKSTTPLSSRFGLPVLSSRGRR
jgi:hypothetical protein